MSVGLIGLGAMGAPIAKSLAASGLRVFACDVVPGRAEEAVPDAALHSTTPREVAVGASAVLVVVADDTQADDAIRGPRGILDGMTPGSVIVLHSTLSPGFCRDLRADTDERGIGLIDAPLSGGVAGAECRRLTAMVGGEAAELDQVRPILATYCRTIYHLGALGSGQVTKLANNLLATAGLALVREALLLTTAAGIPADTAREVFSASTGQSWAVDGWPDIMENFHRSPGGLDHVRTAILTKDMVLIKDFAESIGIEVPLASAVLDGIGELDEGGIR